MPDYGDSKGFQGSGKAGNPGGFGGSGDKKGGDGPKKQSSPLKDFDSGYTPTQTDYLGTQTFADEGGPAFAETKLEATLDQVVAQNPMVFNKVEDPTVRVDKFGNQKVYDGATGQYVGRIGNLGAVYGLPGIGQYLGMAGSFFGINPDTPTFTVSDIFSKQSGLEREMGGGDGPSDDIMEILYPDVPGEGEDRGEGKAYIDDPVLTGYDLAFKDFYGQQLPTRGFKPMRNGGLASLPMNFNPMTNANPFSMMMRGGQT